MARNVGDLALLLSVIAGPDPRAPHALGDPGSAFAPPLAGSLAGLRVALSVDLGGAFEVDAEVAAVVESSARRSLLRGDVADAHPDLAEADDTFRTLRAWHFQAKFGALLAAAPGRVQAVARRQHPGRGAPHRRRRRPRLRAAHRARASGCATFFDAVRRAGAAGLAGAAVPGRPGVPDRDQRPADGDLPRLDARRRTSSPSPAARRSRCRPARTADGLPVGIQIVAAARPATGSCSRSRPRSRPRSASPSTDLAGPPRARTVTCDPGLRRRHRAGGEVGVGARHVVRPVEALLHRSSSGDGSGQSAGASRRTVVTPDVASRNRIQTAVVRGLPPPAGARRRRTRTRPRRSSARMANQPPDGERVGHDEMMAVALDLLGPGQQPDGLRRELRSSRRFLRRAAARNAITPARCSGSTSSGDGTWGM